MDFAKLTALFTTLLWVSLFRSTEAQCPNEVAIYNPNLRTMTSNETWFIVAVPASNVQTALDNTFGSGVVVLGPVPSDNTTLFPNGFPSGYHPVLASAGYTADIRMASLQIPTALIVGGVYALFVRRPDSEAGTVLSAPLSNYISGPNGNAIQGGVPALASSTFEGIDLREGVFTPNNAAYQLNDGNVYSNNVAELLVPNPLSGPQVTPEAIDFQFFAASALKNVTEALVKYGMNQPIILDGAYLLLNYCQRNQYYFKNATAVIQPRVGNLTLGPVADGADPAQQTGALQGGSPGGLYVGAEGFSVCSQNVGFTPEDCDEASKNVDPAALQ